MAGYIKKVKSDGPPPLTMAVQPLQVLCAQKLIEENNLFDMIYDHDYLEDERLSINECQEIAANFADNEDETFYDLRRKVKDFLRDKKKCDVTATIIDSVLRLKNCPVLKVGAYQNYYKNVNILGNILSLLTNRACFYFVKWKVFVWTHCNVF